MNEKAFEMLNFQLRRLNTNQFKRFLEILDRIKSDHEETLRKLRLTVPSNYHKDIDLANSFTDFKKDFLRKEVLNIGNDTFRGIEAEINQFDINFK
jgi:hypothetical protein